MVDAATRDLVRRRAGDRCEYCHLPQSACSLKHHVEHIVARQHGGTDALENLALACHYCNLRKGPNLAGIDPITRNVLLLFDPRHDVWSAHFRTVGPLIEGITDVGRLGRRNALGCAGAVFDDVFCSGGLPALELVLVPGLLLDCPQANREYLRGVTIRPSNYVSAVIPAP